MRGILDAVAGPHRRPRASAVAVATLVLGVAVGLAACGGTGATRGPAPAAPSGVVALPGDGAALVSWTTPSPGAATPPGYRATAEPGGRSCAATASLPACSIVGLANGSPYRISVRAVDTAGPGPASGAVPITPGVPGPPTGVTDAPGDTSVAVGWTAPAGNGSTVTGGRATAWPGGASCSTDGTTACTILGLADGTPYTVTVTATNARGVGPASAPGPPVTPSPTAGGSPGIAYLGPVFATGESPTAVQSRDVGLSVALPSGRDLWIFGDTSVFAATGGWTSSSFVAGSTFARSGTRRGHVPTSLHDSRVRGALTSEGSPTQFVPAPTDVVVPGSGHVPCTSSGLRYPARWPTGAAVLDATEILVSYEDVCVESPTSSTAEGWGFMLYDWRTDRIRVGPVDVVPPSATGAPLPPVDTFGWPVVAGGTVTFFSSVCSGLFIVCPSGQVDATTVADTPAALENPASYRPAAVPSSAPGGGQPAGLSVTPDPGAGLLLVEQTSIGGTFDVLRAPGPGGPWTPLVSGTLPGCSSTPHGFCYAFVAHPELSGPSRLVLSYFKPDAGPDPAAGHLVLAAVPLGY